MQKTQGSDGTFPNDVDVHFMNIWSFWQPHIQCEAPKIDKLVYNSINYMLYGTQLPIVTGA